MKRVALYTRVSTDSQTTENQERELRQVAGRSGWDVVLIYTDQGIGGAKGRDRRPAFDQIRGDAARRLTPRAKPRLRLGPAYIDNGLVNPRPDGSPRSPDDLTGAFTRLVRKLKMAVRFDDLRHTHISHLLAAGVHPMIASERAGHVSVAITLDVDSHVTPNLQEDAADRVDAVLRQALEE